MAVGVEELINSLYEIVQNAWNIPLGADKCVVEKDKVLDLLDDITAALPNDLKMAKDVVAKRNEILDASKKEADTIRQKARDEAKLMVSEDEIVKEARKKANEIITTARTRAKELRNAANEYCDESMRKIEEAMALNLDEIRAARQDFREVANKAANAQNE